MKASRLEFSSYNFHVKFFYYNSAIREIREKFE